MSHPTLACLVGMALDFQWGPDSASFSEITSAGACETQSSTREGQGEGLGPARATSSRASLLWSHGALAAAKPTASPTRPTQSLPCGLSTEPAATVTLWDQLLQRSELQCVPPSHAHTRLVFAFPTPLLLCAEEHMLQGKGWTVGMAAGTASPDTHQEREGSGMLHTALVGRAH